MKERYTATELIKKISELEGNRRAIIEKSDKLSVFQCASTENEDELRPEYDFKDTFREIGEINGRIVKYKHALNLFNTSTYVGNTGHTIDEVLVILPQLNSLKENLRIMSGRTRKERVADRYSSPVIIDYTIANYDIDEALEKYKKVQNMVREYQLALDKANMTEVIEIEI